jgi:hypothetical protein
MILKFAKQERFYHVYEQANFFGGVTLVCCWGTFDSNRGGYKYVYCDNIEEIYSTREDIKNTRLKRGYKAY